MTDVDPTGAVLVETDGAGVRTLTFNRPERGNAIVTETPSDLAAAVERADLDPRVHVILLSGRGKGFFGGYDLLAFADLDPDSRALARARIAECDRILLELDDPGFDVAAPAAARPRRPAPGRS